MGVFQTPCAFGVWKGVVPKRIPQNIGQGGGFVAVGRRFSLGWAGKLDLGPPKQRSRGQAPSCSIGKPIEPAFLELIESFLGFNYLDARVFQSLQNLVQKLGIIRGLLDCLRNLGKA